MPLSGIAPYVAGSTASFGLTRSGLARRLIRAALGDLCRQQAVSSSLDLIQGLRTDRRWAVEYAHIDHN